MAAALPVKFARNILLLLCSLTLLLSPLWLAKGSAVQAKSSCRACNCADCSCCVKSPVSDAPATPAAPSNHQSTSEWQGLLVALISLPSVPSAPARYLSLPANPSLRVVAIPLYERNCAYVI